MEKNKTLRNILEEYSEKRFISEKKAEEKKREIYSKNTDLENIEKQINLKSIHKINMLLQNNTEQIAQIDLEINNLKKEKEKIMKNLNISSKSFLPHYECNICNDTGYIKNGNKTIMCNCLKQKIFNIEYNKSNIGNIEKENFNTFNELLYSNEVDEKLNISPRENIKIIKKISENFIKNFDNPNEKNLLFTGNIGLGKTFLCNCIAFEILKKGKTVLYQTAPVMIDSIINHRFGKQDSSINIVDNLINVDLLIIDDLGTESLNSMKLTELFTIINSRLLNQNNKITKTIISTNLSLENIFSVYNERIGSRIIGYYNICKFIGDDIRLKQQLK